jgi:hypothetical protein
MVPPVHMLDRGCGSSIFVVAMFNGGSCTYKQAKTLLSSEIELGTK